MRHEALLHILVTLFYTLAVIVMVSPRHIQNSEHDTQQDDSKSGKPGEYLWYKTGSEQKVAKSFIAKSTQERVVKQLTFDSDGNQELNSGVIPAEEENDLSGSGEPNEAEYMSGSGSYPTSYMVSVDETVGNSFGKRPNGDTASEGPDLETSGEENAEFSGENKKEDTGEETESSEHEMKKQDSSGSADVEQEDTNNRDTDKTENERRVEPLAPAVDKKVTSPKRRSEIYRKSKVTKGNSDSEYDKLLKDFKNDGDLGLDLEDDDDDDGDLDDALNEEETKLLISEGNKEETGGSKSTISHRDHDGGDLSSMFREFSGDSSTSVSSGESRAVHKKTRTSKMKEILSKLDSDIFRGHKSEEHVNHHSEKHRYYHKQHYYHHQNETAKEAESSRALSHHAQNGIFNGSVSNVTLEAQKVKKQHPQNKHDHYHGHHHRHHHRHYHHQHHHHHHRHHHHQQQHEIETHKDDIGENQVPAGNHLHQSNSSAQYSSVQSPSIYYPAPSSGPAVAVQPQPSPEEISLMQFYQQSTNGYEYHAVKNADTAGAVCLDGSTPGYFLRQGSGKGSKNWIIYLQGGAWCESEETCLARSRMHLGSSLFFKPLGNPGGILSNINKENPEFYDWNVAYLPYCDGSSFSGNRSDPVEVEGSLLYFRGLRILDSTISELLSDTNLKEASHVIFSGTSAGGLAVMLHADFVRSKLPKKVHFRALADSGFFLDTASRKQKGQRKFRKIMQSVFKLHDCTDGVPQHCVENMSGKKLWKCIFPQYFLPFVKSRLFVVNPLYDSWQLGNIWEIPCASHPYSCTKKELKQIKKFRKTTLKAMKRVIKGSANIALFADSCIDHGQVIFNAQWNTIKVMRKSISSSFAKWYHKPKKEMYFIDEDYYPANPTCVTKDVDKRSEIFTEGF